MKTLLKEMKKGIFPISYIKNITIHYDSDYGNYNFAGDALDLICETQAHRIACNLVQKSKPFIHNNEIVFYSKHSATKMIVELKAV
jgi:hypothetical protein